MSAGTLPKLPEVRSVLVGYLAFGRGHAALSAPGEHGWQDIERIAASCEAFLLAKARRDAAPRIATLHRFALGAGKE